MPTWWKSSELLIADETIEKEEVVRRHAGGMPLLTDLSLAMRADPLAIIRGTTEFVTVIYGPAVTFAFPDVKVETYRRSVFHVNLISAVDGSALNWCEQSVLRELMSEDLLFAKISEPEMTAIKFDDRFRDRMGEVGRGQIEVFPKLWNLRPYNKTNGEITRIPRLMASYHKVREETKGWGDYKKLPEEIPEFQTFLAYQSFQMGPGVKSKALRVQGRIRSETTRREKTTVDRKNLCNRILVKLER